MPGCQPDWNEGVVVDKDGLQSRDEKIEFYDTNATTYDEFTSSIKYQGPRITAQILHNYFKSNQSANMLDLGAGTGLPLIELKKLGNYPNITALDASASMLDVLEERKLCSSIICQIFKKDSDLPANSYDGIFSVGCFAPGHFGLDTLEEICKIAKPGGMILIMSRARHFEEGIEFADKKFYHKITELETTGQWKIERNEIVPEYCVEEAGKLFVFRKC